MKDQELTKVARDQKSTERPAYVQPRVQVMSERDVLNTFQVTQAMQTWWVAGC
jgi:hypothetical protein